MLYYKDNYRPISVISIVAKIMEKLVHSQLFSYLEWFDILIILIVSQHGFRPLHSTVTALLKLTNQWYSGPPREFAGPGAKFPYGAPMTSLL